MDFLNYKDVDDFLDNSEFLSLKNDDIKSKYDFDIKICSALRRYHTALRDKKDVIEYIQKNSNKESSTRTCEKIGITKSDYFVIKKLCTNYTAKREKFVQKRVGFNKLVEIVYDIIETDNFFHERKLIDYLRKKYKISSYYALDLTKQALFYKEYKFSDLIPHSNQMLVLTTEDILSVKRRHGYEDDFLCPRRSDCLECAFKFSDNLIFNCKDCVWKIENNIVYD